MSEREVLCMVLQFLSYPPTGGNCAMINIDAMQTLLNNVAAVLQQKDIGGNK